MIRVAALTAGKNLPSRRFRVEPYIKRLSKSGIMVNEYVPAISKRARLWGWPKNISHMYIAPLWIIWQGIKLSCRFPGIINSWTHDITWLQKEMLPGFPTLERFLKKPLVFDVDDAIWLEPPMGSITMRLIAKRSTIVLAGNNYIADWFSKYCPDIRILPTGVDTDLFRPMEEKDGNSSSRFTIGWIGSWENLPFLLNIRRPLTKFLTENRDARLLVMANVEGDWPQIFSNLPADQVCFKPWSETTEAKTVQSMDVGLMPLTDDRSTRGKCSLKMLQYMACGLPVVVSPVGMNVEVLKKGEIGFAAEKASDWYDYLNMLYQDREKGKRCGILGRKVVENNYSARVISQYLAEIFKELHKRSS